MEYLEPIGIVILAIVASSSSQTTECQRQISEAGPPIPGKYIPQCTNTGKFEQIQCHGSTGFCWCVNNINGEELVGTRRGPGEGKPLCEQCDEVRCRMNCEYGFKQDANGCNICECNAKTESGANLLASSIVMLLVGTSLSVVVTQIL
ncbi:equistatin-like [Amphiura filiformis]|uniref:equistatin-like n=1 Tax=Amphiura filiformis TaxID=82378 RepID=UPI003B215CA2